jgi:hypothetical protein
MIATYSRVEEIKQALREIKPDLLEIEGRGQAASVATYGIATDIPIHDSLKTDSPFAIDPRVQHFTEWFIRKAHDMGEMYPTRIRGYIGFIGDKGQMLDYLHYDNRDERITTTITSLEGWNPSTKTFPVLPYSHPEAKAQLQYLDKSCAVIPDEYFQTQVVEGGIVHFVKNQLHTEAILPIGAAKIFLSADYKY